MDNRRTMPCYCEIPEETLRRLAYACFVLGCDPGHLRKTLKTARERRYLAAIALYPLRPEDLIRLLELRNPYELHHLLDCRRRIEAVLHEYMEVPFRRWPGKTEREVEACIP